MSPPAPVPPGPWGPGPFFRPPPAGFPYFDPSQLPARAAGPAATQGMVQWSETMFHAQAHAAGYPLQAPMTDYYRLPLALGAAAAASSGDGGAAAQAAAAQAAEAQPGRPIVARPGVE